MELDELRLAWHSLDTRIDATQRLQAATVRELKMARAHSALRPLVRLIYLELALGVLAVLLLGGFLAEHWDVARYAIPGLALHVCAILTVINAVSQLAMVGKIDYAGPVVAAQEQLAQLKARRAFAARWQLLLAALVWTPFAIVVARGLLGFDLYGAFGWTWVNVNLAFGVLLIPVLSWVTRRFADRLEHGGVLKSIADHIAGKSLANAMRSLDEIAKFERVHGT